MNKFSQKSLDNLKGVHPDLVKVAHKALELSMVDFGIGKSVRTQAEQDALYEQGRTTEGEIVTWTRSSLHIPGKDGYSHAIDVIAYIDGKVSWQKDLYKEISKAFINASISLGIPVKWLGATTSDLGHFQLI